MASELGPRGLGRVALAAVAFAALAPVGLCVVPLAALLVASRPRRPAEWLLAAGMSLWALAWLLEPGPPPEQLIRAAALIGGATFALATCYSRSSVTHRALLAATSSAVALAVLFTVLGWSWGDVRWWVAHRAGFAVRVALGGLAAARRSGRAPEAPVPELEAWLARAVQFLADQFAAVVAVQLLAGLGLAAAIYYRASSRPAGVPPGRFRDFRFSEHLGWVAAVALLVVLVPRLAAAKAAAVNLLLVAGLLYALRGVAVTAFGLALVGGTGWGTAALFGVLAVLVFPALLVGAVLLGLLDAGLDLRRRWAARS